MPAGGFSITMRSLSSRSMLTPSADTFAYSPFTAATVRCKLPRATSRGHRESKYSSALRRTYMKAPFLLGRLIFGGFFLYNGIHHFQQRKQMAQYAASKGVPLAEAAVVGSGAMLTVGGASILLGVKPKIGALAILGFLAGVSPV